jgi:hypothetical protein
MWTRLQTEMEEDLKGWQDKLDADREKRSADRKALGEGRLKKKLTRRRGWPSGNPTEKKRKADF